MNLSFLEMSYLLQHSSRVQTCTDLDTNRIYSQCHNIAIPDALSFGFTFVSPQKFELRMSADLIFNQYGDNIFEKAFIEDGSLYLELLNTKNHATKTYRFGFEEPLTKEVAATILENYERPSIVSVSIQVQPRMYQEESRMYQKESKMKQFIRWLKEKRPNSVQKNK